MCVHVLLNTYTQCAAVNTTVFDINVPPQNGTVEPVVTSATCQGRLFGIALSPLTTTGSTTGIPHGRTVKHKNRHIAKRKTHGGRDSETELGSGGNCINVDPIAMFL